MVLIIISAVNVKAQSDVFFRYHEVDNRDNDAGWRELVLLPKEHGLDYNYPADDAPIASGTLLLIEIGILYGVMRKCKETDT